MVDCQVYTCWVVNPPVCPKNCYVFQATTYDIAIMEESHLIEVDFGKISYKWGNIYVSCKHKNVLLTHRLDTSQPNKQFSSSRQEPDERSFTIR